MPVNKVIVVTGAAGLLGKDLVQRAAVQNEVHAIVRQTPSHAVSGVQYHVIDLGSGWNVRQLPSRPDAVIHLAQSSHFRDMPEQALDVFQVNLATTSKLLDYAWRANAGQFLFASSGGIYGAGSQAFHESSPIAPPEQLGYYLGSKLSGEALAQSYAAYVQVLVFRFFFIYGPGQNRSMLIPRLVDNIVARRSVLLQGPDGIRINPIHVQDASSALIAALGTSESATYNIAGPQVLSMRDIANAIGSAVGRPPVFSMSCELGADLVADISAMRERLHYPRIGFSDGILSTTQLDLPHLRIDDR